MNMREQLHKIKYGPICNVGGDTKTSANQTSTNIDSRSIVTNTLDGGAVSGALGLATAVTGQSLGLASQVVDNASAAVTHGYDFAGGIFNSALDFADTSGSRALNAYDRAGALEASAMNTLQGAYADAKGTSASQKQIIYGVLAVAALALFMAFKRAG